MPQLEQSDAVQELCAAVRDVLPTLNFYIGPMARTAVSRESVEQFGRVVAALKEVERAA